MGGNRTSGRHVVPPQSYEWAGKWRGRHEAPHTRFRLPSLGGHLSVTGSLKSRLGRLAASRPLVTMRNQKRVWTHIMEIF